MKTNAWTLTASLTLALALSGTFSVTGQDAETLRAQLGSPDATERAMAACELNEMGASAVRVARDELLILLTDPSVVDGRLCRDYHRGGWRDGEKYQSSPGREAAYALEELGEDILGPLQTILAGTQRCRTGERRARTRARRKPARNPIARERSRRRLRGLRPRSLRVGTGDDRKLERSRRTGSGIARRLER